MQLVIWGLSPLLVKKLYLSILILSIILSSITVIGSTYTREYKYIRIEKFKYTYKIDDVEGVNYFIYSGDGFIFGYMHKSDICGDRDCKYESAVQVYSSEEFNRLYEIESKIMYLLERDYGVIVHHRGFAYVVNNSINIIFQPIFLPDQDIDLKKVDESIGSIIGENNIKVVLKVLPNELRGDPKIAEDSMNRLIPLLDYIYGVNDTISDNYKEIVEKLKDALMSLNNGSLPGIGFPADYRIMGCLGIVLNLNDVKPSEKEVAEFIRILREIVGYDVPIVVEGCLGKIVPLSEVTEKDTTEDSNLLIPIVSMVAIAITMAALVYISNRH